jgi:hypothetical protein
MKPLPLEIDESIEVKTQLIFNNTDTTGITNLLLIDSIVSECQLFFDSANSTTFPIIYSYNSNRDDFIQLLSDKFKKGLDRISFVFHDNIQNGKSFLNQELLFSDSDISNNASSFSPNTQLLIDTIKKFNIKNIDFLACNSLNYPNWTKFYDLLTKQTNVIVGASNDKTGNLNYGGDWVMENTNENIVNTYFTSAIQSYSSTLATTISQNGGIIYIQQSGSDIQYQSTITTGTWTTISSWPVTFVNTNPISGNILTVSLFTNITISSTQGANGYFITGSNYITYDGTGKTVTIDSIANYLGFIQNGTVSINGSHAITVQNINSSSLNGSTLNGATFTRAGWICQAYFGININNILGRVEILIDNCTNSATISSTGLGNGGIVGGRSFQNGNGTISNCSNSGIINSSNAGGILGIGSGLGQLCNVTNCYNTGLISGNLSGGICGAQSGISGTATITNCYNTGAITGTSSGGICGGLAGAFYNGIVTITNCYNTGTIGNDYCGGICGEQSGSVTGTATITNCYNTGNITGSYSGGITGSIFGYNTNNLCSITNCYNIGNINGTNSGGICGAEVGFNDNVSYFPQVLITGCYSLGDIAASCGGICGGTEGSTYVNIPTVNITNCYTSYTSIIDSGSEYIAVILQIKNNIIKTNVYTTYISSWSDSSSFVALANAPTSIYIGNPGTVWTSTATNTPYVLSAYNAQIYSPNIYTNPDNIYTSNSGLFTPGYNYNLISVNDAIIPPTISINSTSGSLFFNGTMMNHNTQWIEKVFVSKGSTPYYYGYNFNTFTLNQVLCFKEDSKILYLNHVTNKEEYILIQNLRKGDLVKTLLNGFKKVEHIGYSKMYNNVNSSRSKDKLYKLCKTEYQELNEDLIITGCHSILINEFKDQEQRDLTNEILGNIYITDEKYRLPACADERAKIYEEEGLHTIWHFSLENENYYWNYGVYANGLLVETTSNRMMVELSGLTLI